MRNHNQKTKDMQRSVLPSTNRQAARKDRRRMHNAARARERDVLNTFDRSDPDDFDPDFRENHRRSATHWMKWSRRAADKIGPLTRWAVRTVEADRDLRDADLRDQVAHFEALLPGDLIGKHAVFHIRFALEWELHRDARPPHWGRPPGPSRDELRAQVTADVRRVLEAGRHRELNVALRRTFEAGPPPCRFGSPAEPPATRLLLGVHDVDDFADEVSRYPWACDVVVEIAARKG